MHFSQYLLKKIQAVISYWNDQSFLYHSFYQTLKKSVRQIQHNYVHAHFAVHSYGLTTKSVSLMHVCACHLHHFSLALQWRTIFGFKKKTIQTTDKLMQRWIKLKLKLKLKLKAVDSETTFDALFLATDARCMSVSPTQTLHILFTTSIFINWLIIKPINCYRLLWSLYIFATVYSFAMLYTTLLAKKHDRQTKI